MRFSDKTNRFFLFQILNMFLFLALTNFSLIEIIFDENFLPRIKSVSFLEYSI